MTDLSSFDYSPELQTLLRSRRATGRTGQTFSGVGALSTVNNLTVIRNLMLELKPEQTIEIGLAFGGSCLTFAATHRDLNREPSKQHTAIDPFQESQWDGVGEVLLERSGLSDYVDVLGVLSSAALPKLIDGHRTFDMAYVDGSHQFEDVFVDFYFIHELLSVGGVILFDDSTDPHVRKVLGFIETNYDPYYEKMSVAKYRGDDSLGFKFRDTLAAALNKTQLTVYRKKRNGRRQWGDAFRKF
jgi:cephalosporin hydroxylase